MSIRQYGSIAVLGLGIVVAFGWPKAYHNNIKENRDDKVEALDLLLTRRSVRAIDMTDPAPMGEARDNIYQAATRVPDHGKLAPWRFIEIEGDARAAFGQELAEVARQNHPEMDEDAAQLQAELPLRAPLIIVVVSSLKCTKPIPDWEQHLSAGAVCQNMLMAAHAQGFCAQWLTGWMSYDPLIERHLGLQEGEKIAGYIYLGTASSQPDERPRPEIETLVSRYGAKG